MSTFGKAKGGGRRKAERARAPLMIRLSTVADDYRAALVNVSCSGARLTAPDLPPEGEEVVFRADPVLSYGHVVWARDGQCGVSFESPIGPVEVNRLRSEANICGLQNLSPEKPETAKAWHLGRLP
jgi:hypothetical protein